MPNTKSTGGTQVNPRTGEKECVPMREAHMGSWAHGDGNLRVFRVVPERRPNRRKVLALQRVAQRPEAL